MDIAMRRNSVDGFVERVRNVGDMLRLSNIEKMLSNALETMPDKSVVDYVGELNKNDVMH